MLQNIFHTTVVGAGWWEVPRPRLVKLCVWNMFKKIIHTNHH